MKRLTLVVAMLAFVVAFAGCGTFKAMDGSSEREVQAFDEGKPVVARGGTFKPVQIPQMEPKPVTGLAVGEREPVMVAEVEEPEPEPEMIAEIEEPEPVVECPTCPPCREVVQRSISDIRIKVLNGNGISGSANKMKNRLKKMGYMVERVDNAPRKNFKTNTVFYAECCKTEAKTLAGKLGGSTIKPITWYSVFDIIVTTGQKQ